MSIPSGEAEVTQSGNFGTYLKINGTNVGHLLKSYQVTKIKQVMNSQTATDGSIIYDKIPGWCYRLQIQFLPLTKNQMSSLAALFNDFEVSVSFFNPYTGAMVNNYQCYPNDQNSSIMFAWNMGASNERLLYNEMSLNLIGIKHLT